MSQGKSYKVFPYSSESLRVGFFHVWKWLEVVNPTMEIKLYPGRARPTLGVSGTNGNSFYSFSIDIFWLESLKKMSVWGLTCEEMKTKKICPGHSFVYKVLSDSLGMQQYFSCLFRHVGSSDYTMMFLLCTCVEA